MNLMGNKVAFWTFFENFLRPMSYIMEKVFLFPFKVVGEFLPRIKFESIKLCIAFDTIFPEEKPVFRQQERKVQKAKRY